MPVYDVELSIVLEWLDESDREGDADGVDETSSVALGLLLSIDTVFVLLCAPVSEGVMDHVGGSEMVAPEGEREVVGVLLMDATSDGECVAEAVGSGDADGVRVGGRGNVIVTLTDTLPEVATDAVVLTETDCGDRVTALEALGLADAVLSTVGLVEIDAELDNDIVPEDALTDAGLALTSVVGDAEAENVEETVALPIMCDSVSVPFELRERLFVDDRSLECVGEGRDTENEGSLSASSLRVRLLDMVAVNVAVSVGDGPERVCDREVERVSVSSFVNDAVGLFVGTSSSVALWVRESDGVVEMFIDGVRALPLVDGVTLWRECVPLIVREGEAVSVLLAASDCDSVTALTVPPALLLAVADSWPEVDGERAEFDMDTLRET